EIHDVYTRGHSQNVAELSREIARELDLSPTDINNAYWAGLVHDIGKTLVPDRILNKSGELTGEEFASIKKHSLWGYQTLNNSEYLQDIAEYVLYHHERWDGQGYPSGRAGEEIPIISRIICLADAWDAMRSRRAYRAPLSYEEALKELKENRREQFDPRVVDAFLNIHEEIISIG
ncbi:MAG: HD-GYP domain-containing protein, partial [Bacillota bacterium]